MEQPSRFVIGHHDPKRPLPVTVEALQEALAANYDMLTSPITTPHFHSRVLSLLSTSLSPHAGATAEDVTQTRNASPVTVAPLTPADSPLSPQESISQLIAVTSSWIDLASSDPIIADVSRQILRLELAYAAFCGITYVLIPGPRLCGHGASEPGVVQYARAILDALSQGPYMQLFVWLPMADAEEPVGHMGDLGPFARPQFVDRDRMASRPLDLFGSWEAWDMIRSICKYPSRLGVALSIPSLLPPVSVQSRWYSEPVRLLTLDARVFSKNPKNYPALTRPHQVLINRFAALRTAPWFLLCDVGPIPPSNLRPAAPGMSSPSAQTFPTFAEAASSPSPKDATPHLSYMRNLESKQPLPTALDQFSAGYHDYLQAPLQPLTVNLESVTYEVFEKDPIKYAWYERAIARALHDWIEQGKPTSNPDGRVVVAVVGAGRGPLVTRALKASEDVGVDIDMWALEKNPNAFVLLQRHNHLSWNNRVKLVKSDMRSWTGPVRPTNASQNGPLYNVLPEEATMATTATTLTGPPSSNSATPLATQNANLPPTPYKIDILISELLGSFADNELSPECLDGVQHLLNPVHGISIPASYSAHITPIAAPKLHADIQYMTRTSTSNPAEIPYVVMLNAIDFLSTTAAAPPLLDATSSSPAQALPSALTTTQIPYSKAHTRQSPSPSPSLVSPPTSAQLPPPPIPVIGKAWSFHHPNLSLPKPTTTTSSPTVTTDAPATNAHNARGASLTFPIPNRGTCHGLAGYFETVLYRGVELSTNPNTMDSKSEGMISWFPIFFPLKNPIFLPDASEVVLSMWRRTDDRKVWYEWLVDVYAQASPTSRGKRVRIGGSELHSSEKEACLM